VASETLAHLLERQERHDKAIEVYERLILLNPEKSAFFAKKIEELKKLL
jgi:tetratricopeptide (TPR) repeat protein